MVASCGQESSLSPPQAHTEHGGLFGQRLFLWESPRLGVLRGSTGISVSAPVSASWACQQRPGKGVLLPHPKHNPTPYKVALSISTKHFCFSEITGRKMWALLHSFPQVLLLGHNSEISIILLKLSHLPLFCQQKVFCLI